MEKSIFNPEHQLESLSGKIVVGLERISQAFKVLLWEKAKELSLSPIQIQLLIFVAYHKSELNNVSFLAQEFNVTKPTISDAVKVLHKKGLVDKEYLASDSRSYSIRPSAKGERIVTDTESFAAPIAEGMANWTAAEKTQFFASLSKLIFQLNKIGVLSVQRTCYSCKYLEKQHGKHYCNFLRQPLSKDEIRLDCPEFENN